VPSSVVIYDLNGDGMLDLAASNFEQNTVSVLLAIKADVCTVPNATGATLRAAAQAIGDAHCRIGEIGRAHSNRIKKGRVISEYPRPGTVLPNRGKVDLVVSLGRIS
jgi:beta-lactam-binding protein with PASTA domain